MVDRPVLFWVEPSRGDHAFESRQLLKCTTHIEEDSAWNLCIRWSSCCKCSSKCFAENDQNDFSVENLDRDSHSHSHDFSEYIRDGPDGPVYLLIWFWHCKRRTSEAAACTIIIPALVALLEKDAKPDEERREELEGNMAKDAESKP
jgi:hypothetical protein